jgi:hypothetical protein
MPDADKLSIAISPGIFAHGSVPLKKSLSGGTGSRVCAVKKNTAK